MFSYVEPISVISWPGPTVTLFDSLFLNYVRTYNLKLPHDKDTGLKIFLSAFDQNILVYSEITAFFAKADF